MKTRITAILAGVAFLHLLLISIITVSGGCKSPEALQGRRYLSDPKAFQTPAPGPQEQVVVEETTVVEEPVKPVAETPAAQPAAAPVTEEVVIKVDEKLITYKVENGDSLWKIARKFGVGTGELAAINKLNPKSVLRVGQALTIPPGGVVGYQPKAVPHTAKAKTTTKTATKTAFVSTEGGTKYTVAAGDSLWKIAAKHNVKSSAIAEANKITPSKPLRVGQVIIIPGKKSSSVADVVNSAKAKIESKASKPVKSVDAAKKPEETLSAEESKALEGLKTDDTKSVDDLLKDIPAAEPETPAATTPATAKTGDIVEVTEDTTIDAFAQKYKVSSEDLKKANPGLPDNGKLSSGMIITLP